MYYEEASNIEYIFLLNCFPYFLYILISGKTDVCLRTFLLKQVGGLRREAQVLLAQN